MALKIVLVSEYFYPTTTGGTELYVFNLAKALINLGNIVYVLTCNHETTTSEYDGIPIVSIPFNKDYRRAVIQEKTPPDNVHHFMSVIHAEKPDIIHFHTLTTSINLFHITTVKQSGFPVILTSHIPGHICLRGDLVYMNKEVCDGIIQSQKCLSCFYLSKGIISPFNQLTAALIKYGDYIIPNTDVAKNKKNTIIKLNETLDALIIVSEWQREMFIENGFDSKKIHLCRQALIPTPNTQQKSKNSLFTIGFTGRVTKSKGLHLLLEALKLIDNNSFCLKLAVIPVDDEVSYFHEMKSILTQFSHYQWIEDLPNTEIHHFMQSIDVLCVPSIWLETGPFVAYEAFAAGTPVLGSNCGGIKELIRKNENGWLFELNNPKDLAEKIKLLIEQYQKSGSLSIHRHHLRTYEDMGNEMSNIYVNLSQ